LLFEEPGGPLSTLPAGLAKLHGGGFALARRLLYANFVTSLDGVTAVDPAAAGQGGLISGGLAADRFLMGLLRAHAEVVLIGAGTLRAEPAHRWSPDRVYPPAARPYAELRERLGLPVKLPLAVVTGSGRVDPTLPALAGGMILTTRSGRAQLGAVPEGVRVVVLGEGPAVAAAAALRIDPDRGRPASLRRAAGGAPGRPTVPDPVAGPCRSGTGPGPDRAGRGDLAAARDR
jgi:riboflavin biosynthesis pyrimidine reductase